ncbi:MAG: hypothetical protein GWN47_02970 [Woeseiaceae bacterium]|nr:hypothetical protein [Woeseiaceae bacterium]
MAMLKIGWVLLAALMVSACGGGSNSNQGPPPGPPLPAPTTGLDARPSNTTCVAPARAPAAGAVDIADAFPGLPGLNQPTKVLVEPVADPRWFVLQKTGQLRVFDPDNATSLTTYLDLSGIVRTASEGGLLGMAFHPDYPAVAEIFLSYTVNGTSTEMRSVFSRVMLDDVASPSAIGAGSVEQVLLEVDQFASNHNGGDIAFGADDLLYIGLGDGGGANDPQETGQDTTRLLGSFLRLDVIGTGADYNIPAGNPFSGNAKCGPGINANSCPEIYAWGFRNPWRWSFDPATGVLWAGDVGQGTWEEIDQVEVGNNYGWDCREGAHDFETAGCSGPFVDPVAEYEHSSGPGSVTGGFVYRGASIPSLVGRYVFADFEIGRFWALRSDGVGGFTNEILLDTSTGPSSFGVDENGELYFTDFFSGRIMRLVASGGGGADPVAEQLSASGCVDPADVTQPYSGLVPYGLNAPFWSDGADKERHMGLPNGTTMSVDADDDWDFPPGTVIVKNFRLNGQLIETRHLMRHPDGVWAGYTYEWNAQETEATRVRSGKTVQLQGQDWIFPAESDCLVCHTSVAGVALGPETAQLNRDFTYPSTGRTHNQIETLDSISMFSAPIGDPALLPSMPDPTDASADLTDRARAYLHTNCAQCHQPGGPTPVDIDLRYTTPLAATNTCDVVPDAGGLGLILPRIIAPGDASRSVLVARTDRRDVDGMPPLGSAQVDVAGVALLTDWVNSLGNCN